MTPARCRPESGWTTLPGAMAILMGEFCLWFHRVAEERREPAPACL